MATKRKRRKAAKRANPRRKRHAAPRTRRANPAPRSNPRRRRRARRSNPGYAAAPRSNPRRRSSRRRRRNPSIPAPLQRAGSALIGAALVVGAGYGALKLSQKFPAKSVGTGVAMQLAAGTILGGGLAALGFPAAGAISAVGFGSTALAMATQTPTMGTTSSAPVGALLQEKQMRGLVEGDSYEQAMRQRGSRQQDISGLITALRN
jgi:hypothetical protein